MSTTKKVPTRPVKPKITPPKPVQETPVATEPSPTVTVPVEPSPAPVEAPAATESPAVTESSTSAPKRVQTNKAIKVNISSARVRRHLDKLCLNSEVDAKIAELKAAAGPHTAALAALNALGDADKTAAQAAVDALTPEAAVIASKIAALSRERTRFSNEASIALSIIIDYMIQQMGRHTMDACLESGMKFIKKCYFHSKNIESLSLATLFAKLPSFVATQNAIKTAAHDAAVKAHDAALLAQAEKDFKKKYNVVQPKKAPEAAPEPAAVAEVPAESPEVPAEVVESDEESESKTTFRFYVHGVCKELSKSEPKFKSVRVSTEIRNYFSDLVVEFIKRLAPLIHETAMSMKNKTVSDLAVLKTVENILIDGHASVETIELKTGQSTCPVALKAELAKQAEEKAAGREYKINHATLPKVDGFVACRTITYPTSGYADLAERVAEKLALYRKYGEETEKTEKAEKPEL